MTIEWKGSPNFDSNRKSIDRIVIHWFGGGTLEAANVRFQNASNQVSAHYGISDLRIWQWVQEDKVAYHAGNYAMNQRSIGIEHDANPEKPLSETSYKTSAILIANICKRQYIPLDRSHIIAHREVKATQCPGTIDLDKLIRLAKEAQGVPPTGGSMNYDELGRKAEAYYKSVGVGSFEDFIAKIKEHVGPDFNGGFLAEERNNKVILAKQLKLPENTQFPAILEAVKALQNQSNPQTPPSGTQGQGLPSIPGYTLSAITYNPVEK